jgi:hypothetical protein
MKTARKRLEIYGLLAEFDGPEPVLAAARDAYREGYRHLDAHTPFPVEGLAEAVGFQKRKLPLIVLLGGLAGLAAGYGLQYYAAVVGYPMNVGGRPLHSWPQFIPVTFEMTILGAALAAVLGMLALNKLPQPYHPLFNVPEFERASQNRFFLCIEATDPRFDRRATHELLQSFKPRAVHVVEQ